MDFFKSILHNTTLQEKSWIEVSFEKSNLIFINNQKVKDTGSYILVINSEYDGGATYIYCISRSDKKKRGHVLKLTGSHGLHNEYIECIWDKFEHPKLIFVCHSKEKVTRSFRVTIY